jgi:hypothetical protein
LSVVIYGCEVWFLTWRNFKYTVLGKIFGPKRDEVERESGEDYITRSLITGTPPQILFG